MSVGCVYSIKRTTVPTNGFMQPRQAIKIERLGDDETDIKVYFFFYTLFFSPPFFFLFFFIVK